MEKFGLVLGAGGAKGFAHVGVLEALHDLGYAPSCIVGSSVGSVVAVLYGWNDIDIVKIAQDMQVSDVLERSWFLRDGGRYKIERIEKFVNDRVCGRDLRALHIPVGVVVTDLISGEPQIFSRGNAGLLASASAAVPGMFRPVHINGGVYVDGGVTSAIPIDECRNQFGLNKIIAVNISSFKAFRPQSGIWHTLDRSVNVMYHHGIQSTLIRQSPKDTMVLSPDVGFMRYDLEQRERAMEVGRKAVLTNLEQIEEFLNV